MNQLNAFAPAIVGAVSLVAAAISALVIAFRAPAKIRKQRKEAKAQASLPFERLNNVTAAPSRERQPEHA
jgi:hypothetical protein